MTASQKTGRCAGNANNPLGSMSRASTITPTAETANRAATIYISRLVQPLPRHAARHEKSGSSDRTSAA
ncbi:MAG: hypothetical protein KGI97_00665 [Alphaproteobacteria bacterium]|nr:hypothetical protein [Alphaproteobacteria bacterium]